MSAEYGPEGLRLYVGIDLGTSGASGVLVDDQGAEHGAAQTSYQSTYPHRGHVEQDPELDWWRATVELCQSLLAKVDTRRIGAVCVSGLGPCVVVADDAGRPLRQAILYGVDSRSMPQIRRLELDSEVDSDGLTTQAVGPKLMWVRDEEPHIWADVRHIFTSHTYVAYRLSGAYFIDRVSAELWDPFWDKGSNDWRRELASRLAPGPEWPEVVEPDSVVGQVGIDAAVETGIPVGTPVAAGTIDYAAEVVGAGTEDPGEAVIVYGSTLSINVVAEPCKPVDGLTVSAAVRAGTRYIGGVTSASGLLLEWMRTSTGYTSFESFTDAANSVMPGSGGVTIIPHFAGERSPGFRSDATGSIVGLRLEHGPPHLARAALEAVAFSARSIVELVRLTGSAPRRVVAVGGGTINRLLLQIISDVTQVPQEVRASSSGATYGAAILGARSIGIETRAWHSNGADYIIEPVTPMLEEYELAYARYGKVDRALKDLV